MKRKGIMLASVSGFFAVALGAFAAHGLKHSVSSQGLSIFNTAVNYHFYHTFALLACALGAGHLAPKLLAWAMGFFTLGIGLFSGSLYLYAITSFKWLGPITPIGGLCFLLGWTCLFMSAWRNQSIKS